MPVEPWEVFRQEKDGEPMTHVGNLLAPDPELALHYARELAGRRQESIRLWVVPRSAIQVLDDPDLLKPPLDRSFKKPGGYVMREKLRTARHRATASAEEPAQEDASPLPGDRDDAGSAANGAGSRAAVVPPQATHQEQPSWTSTQAADQEQPS